MGIAHDEAGLYNYHAQPAHPPLCLCVTGRAQSLMLCFVLILNGLIKCFSHFHSAAPVTEIPEWWGVRRAKGFPVVCLTPISVLASCFRQTYYTIFFASICTRHPSMFEHRNYACSSYLLAKDAGKETMSLWWLLSVPCSLGPLCLVSPYVVSFVKQIFIANHR